MASAPALGRFFAWSPLFPYGHHQRQADLWKKSELDDSRIYINSPYPVIKQPDAPGSKNHYQGKHFLDSTVPEP